MRRGEQACDLPVGDFKLKSIRKASTFKGFCAYHDRTLFEPLEKGHDFEGTPEQCFLLGYRALAFELYKKQAVKSLSPMFYQLDKGRPPEVPLAIQENNASFQEGMSLGGRDLARHKEFSDAILTNRKFNDVRGYIIELQTPPPVMCSTGIAPTHDFQGHTLQDLNDPDHTMDMVFITAFHGGSYGAVAFSWLPQSEPTCWKLLASLDAVPDKDLTAALLRFMFEYCENLHIQPDWWDGLPEFQREVLRERFRATSTVPFEGWGIMDDGVSFAPWSVSRRHRVGKW